MKFLLLNTHLLVLRADTWLCAKGSLLAVLRVQYGITGKDPRLAACKPIDLSAVILLQITSVISFQSICNIFSINSLKILKLIIYTSFI